MSPTESEPLTSFPARDPRPFRNFLVNFSCPPPAPVSWDQSLAPNAGFCSGRLLPGAPETKCCPAYLVLWGSAPLPVSLLGAPGLHDINTAGSCFFLGLTHPERFLCLQVPAVPGLAHRFSLTPSHLLHTTSRVTCQKQTFDPITVWLKTLPGPLLAFGITFPFRVVVAPQPTVVGCSFVLWLKV